MQLWISKLRLNRIFSCLEFEMQDELGHITSISFKWNCKYAINCHFKEATCRIQTYLFLAGFCWPVHEEVLKQWCSENHYSDTNPQLKHEILEAGSLRSNTEYTILQNTPLPLTNEFSFRKTTAHQLFFQKKKRAGRLGGRKSWKELMLYDDI